MGGERVLKYLGTEERYVFEMLMFCEVSREEWDEKFRLLVDGKMTDILGPYPENGEYELVKVIEKVHVDARTKKVLRTEFAPLTSTLCDALVETAIQNRNLPAKHKQLAAQERRAKEEAEKEQRMIDRIDDMGLAFGGKTFVTVPSSAEIAKYS